MPCEFELFKDCPIGKLREVKTVPVWVPEGPWKEREAIARKAVSEHEVDGWEGRAPTP